MNGSLSRRLAAMFAGCAAAVFVLGGVLLDSSVRSSLDDQVRDELQLRAQLFDAYAAKVSSAEQWIDKVVPKLDAIAADTGGARLWIEADASAFRYGRPPAQLEGKVVQTPRLRCDPGARLSLRLHHAGASDRGQRRPAGDAAHARDGPDVEHAHDRQVPRSR